MLASLKKLQSTMPHALYSLLADLDAARVHYAISRDRTDSVLVTITFVGERVEVDVFDDGHMEISRFQGGESIEGGAQLVYGLIQGNGD